MKIENLYTYCVVNLCSFVICRNFLFRSQISPG